MIFRNCQNFLKWSRSKKHQNKIMIFSSNLLKPLLFIISLIYKALVLLRLQGYKNGWLKTHRTKTPVISVGNLTVGGSGKTPVVDLLVKELQSRKIKPAILSRGYGRNNPSSKKRLLFCEENNVDHRDFGDEPYLLAMRNPEVPVHVNNSRIAAAYSAETQDYPDVLILDDAYQHLAIHRDLNLLLIDAERGLENHSLIPHGVFREHADQWVRADAIIITKANIASAHTVSEILNNEMKVTCPVFTFNYEASGLTRMDGKTRLNIQQLDGKNLLTIAGIAQPSGFRRLLENHGGNLIGSLEYADHHDYSIQDVRKILKEQQNLNPDYIVTTEKDAVKLRQFHELSDQVWILEMEVQPEDSWQAYFDEFLAYLHKA